MSANKPNHSPSSQHQPSGQKVPTGRLARLGHLASLAGKIAGGVLAEGAKQLAQGQKPALQQLLLTPANAKHLANQLSQMRGAAMKLGQLLSMDAGDVLPEALTSILAQLRANASPMLPSQLATVLRTEWGADWQQQFSHFAFAPIAAASIGQVHQANHDKGQPLAVKVQYPGISTSIDSDVDNVASLLRISGLLPADLDLAPLLAEAKRQLHKEADYLQEAAYLARYRQHIADDQRFLIPTLYPELCTAHILTMGFVEGVPVESLQHLPQAQRDHLMSLLFELLFKELFVFGLVQTDPNYANYRYNEQTQQLVLLDFGACRDYGSSIVDGYRQLFRALLAQHHTAQDNATQDFTAQNSTAQNNTALLAALRQIGYFSADINPAQQQAVLALVALAGDTLASDRYDFASSDLPLRMRDAGLQLSMRHNYWHTPPVDALFLHRKMAGMFLLAKTLKAKVPLRALLQPYV
ncbi:MAG TPA: ubiquinol-cytochrome C reductase [Rheinheimera sp.]|nr:ubiquinol-cytochrome C reductase [Rheinheimera sp.]